MFILNKKEGDDDEKCRWNCGVVFDEEVKGVMNFGRTTPLIEDSSDSEEETEQLPKSFHAHLTSNLDIKCSVCFLNNYLLFKRIGVVMFI